MDKENEYLDESHDHDDASIAETTVDETTDNPVVVKKSGGGLALIMSLLALGFSGFMFYQYGSIQSENTENVSYKQLKDLQNKLTDNDLKIKNIQSQFESLESITTQLSTDLNNLSSNVASNLQPSQAQNDFDNSNNEMAIQRLQSQLSDQLNLIQTLRTQIDKIPNEKMAQQILPEDLNVIQQGLTIQALLSAQSLLNSGNVDLAVTSLKNHLNTNSLEPKEQRNIQSLINRIEQIDQPDLNNLSNQLKQIETQITQLQLTTETKVETESNWYDRFISVKKISAENEVESSVDIFALKIDLHRQFVAANAFLNLQIQEGWHDALSNASELLSQKMPSESALITKINQLSQAKIKPEVPKNIGLMDLVNELKGSQ